MALKRMIGSPFGEFVLQNADYLRSVPQFFTNYGDFHHGIQVKNMYGNNHWDSIDDIIKSYLDEEYYDSCQSLRVYQIYCSRKYNSVHVELRRDDWFDANGNPI